MEESQQKILTNHSLGSPLAPGPPMPLREEWPDEWELIDLEEWLAGGEEDDALHDTARKLLKLAWRHVPGRPPMPPLDPTAKRTARGLARSRAREVIAKARAIRQARETAISRGDAYNALHALNGSRVL
jgi:hypothetical protein